MLDPGFPRIPSMPEHKEAESRNQDEVIGFWHCFPAIRQHDREAWQARPKRPEQVIQRFGADARPSSRTRVSPRDILAELRVLFRTNVEKFMNIIVPTTAAVEKQEQPAQNRIPSPLLPFPFKHLSSVAQEELSGTREHTSYHISSGQIERRPLIEPSSLLSVSGESSPASETIAEQLVLLLSVGHHILLASSN